MIFHSQKRGLRMRAPITLRKRKPPRTANASCGAGFRRSAPKPSSAKLAGRAACRCRGFCRWTPMVRSSCGSLRRPRSCAARHLRFLLDHSASGAFAGAARIPDKNIAAEISLRVRPVAFSMGLTDGQQMFFKITYDPAKTGGELSANGAAAALSVGKDQEAAITLVIHGSVVECFANGKTCLTTRVYRIPAGPLSVDVPEPGLRNVVSLQAWQMTPVSPDRLTT